MSPVRGLALAAIACAALVGCSEEATEVVKAVPIGEHDRCKMCGMVIVHYPGPKAEIFIKGADGEAVKFCSGRDAFTFALQPENARRLIGFFIHDMGKTGWEKPDVDGVMGNEPVAFTSQDKAQEFIKKHGGKLYAYKDVTLELLDK